MKVEYRRDIQHSYLVLIAENQDMDKSYALRMITENQIDGLLSCERKLMNNDILYYYGVTGKSSLEDRCKVKKIQGQEVMFLLNRILGILEQLEEYLLSEKSLCLVPQYIYMDENMEQIHFCYVPGECWDFQIQLRELMEYVLPYLEHSNQESMMIGYGLYHYILREQFTVEGLHAQLNVYHGMKQKNISMVQVEKKEVIESDRMIPEKEYIWQDEWEDDTEIQKENIRKNEHWYHYFSALFILIWILAGWFLWRNFVTYLWLWGIIGILLVAVAIVICLKTKVWKRSEKQFSEEKPTKCDMEENREDTQILNIVSNGKQYVLRNESNTVVLKNKDTYIIGRDKKLADIVLQSTVVSRKHGQIRLENNRCFLSDLYSKNGICVNGVRIGEGKEIELFGGELIEFADVSYYFQEEN